MATVLCGTWVWCSRYSEMGILIMENLLSVFLWSKVHVRKFNEVFGIDVGFNKVVDKLLKAHSMRRYGYVLWTVIVRECHWIFRCEIAGGR